MGRWRVAILLAIGLAPFRTPSSQGTPLGDHDPGSTLRSADIGERPQWDEDRAQELVGALLLIGITRVDPSGDAREQMFGIIRSADAHNGFLIDLQGSRGGNTIWLPPHLSNVLAAQPGEHRLRSTGETVVDPDYISDWTIRPPPQ